MQHVVCNKCCACVSARIYIKEVGKGMNELTTPEFPSSPICYARPRGQILPCNFPLAVLHQGWVWPTPLKILKVVIRFPLKYKICKSSGSLSPPQTVTCLDQAKVIMSVLINRGASAVWICSHSGLGLGEKDTRNHFLKWSKFELEHRVPVEHNTSNLRGSQVPSDIAGKNHNNVHLMLTVQCPEYSLRNQHQVAKVCRTESSMLVRYFLLT